MGLKLECDNLSMTTKMSFNSLKLSVSKKKKKTHVNVRGFLDFHFLISSKGNIIDRRILSQNKFYSSREKERGFIYEKVKMRETLKIKQKSDGLHKT